MIDTASSAPNKPALRKLSVPLKLITLPKRKVAQTCAQPTTRGSWSLRHEIHMTLNEHTYSKLSSIISSFIMSTIVLSTLSMVFQSMEEWKDAFPWDHINYFACAYRPATKPFKSPLPISTESWLQPRRFPMVPV
mgnify:CR=1 FL=1